MKLADLKWAAGVFVSAALRPAGHDNCECHPRLGYRGPRAGHWQVRRGYDADGKTMVAELPIDE